MSENANWNESLTRELVSRLVNHLETSPSPVREYVESEMTPEFWKPVSKEDFSFISDLTSLFIELKDDVHRLLELTPFNDQSVLSLPPEPRMFKICLIGDGAVGKTSLRRKYIGQALRENYIPTIGADFSLITLSLGPHSGQITVWDLAGQPKFQTVKGAYFLGSLGAVVVFDITRLFTFFNSFFWIDSLYRYVKGYRPIVLLANKIDLVNRVSPQELFSIDLIISYFQHFLFDRHGIPSSYLKTSAKTGANVKEAFLEIFRNVLLWLQEPGE